MCGSSYLLLRGAEDTVSGKRIQRLHWKPQIVLRGTRAGNKTKLRLRLHLYDVYLATWGTSWVPWPSQSNHLLLMCVTVPRKAPFAACWLYERDLDGVQVPASPGIPSRHQHDADGRVCWSALVRDEFPFLPCPPGISNVYTSASLAFLAAAFPWQRTFRKGKGQH